MGGGLVWLGSRAVVALGVCMCVHMCVRACTRVGACLHVLLQNCFPGSKLTFYLFPEKCSRPPKKPQPPWELASR